MENSVENELTFNLFLDNDCFGAFSSKYCADKDQCKDTKEDFQSTNINVYEDAACLDNFECMEFLDWSQDLNSIISDEENDISDRNLDMTGKYSPTSILWKKKKDWRCAEDLLFCSFEDVCDNLDLIEPSFEALDPTTMEEYSQIVYQADVITVPRIESSDCHSSFLNDDIDDSSFSFSNQENILSLFSDDLLTECVFGENLDEVRSDKSSFENCLSYNPISFQSKDFHQCSEMMPRDPISATFPSHDVFEDLTCDFAGDEMLKSTEQIYDHDFSTVVSSPTSFLDVACPNEYVNGVEMLRNPTESDFINISNNDNSKTILSFFIDNNYELNGDLQANLRLPHMNTYSEIPRNSIDSENSTANFSVVVCPNNSGKNSNCSTSCGHEMVTGALSLHERAHSNMAEVRNAQQSIFYTPGTSSAVNSVNAHENDLTISAVDNSSNNLKIRPFVHTAADMSANCTCPRVNIGFEDNFVSVRVRDILYKNVKGVIGCFKEEEKKSEKQLGKEWKENIRLVRERKKKRLNSERGYHC